MVLVKNLPTTTVNTLSNYGGEIIYDSTINRPIVNISTGFNKFVLSNLNNEVTGLSSITATDITGTLQTAYQPNITTVGTLTGLSSNGDVTIIDHNGSTTGLILGSTLVTATGAELNYVDTTPGTAQANKALVLDSNLSIVGISNIETDSLTVNGTLVTATAIELNYTDVTTVGTAQANKALVVDGNLDIVGIHNLETDNLTVNGTLVTASAIELNYTDVSTIGHADPGKALVLDLNKDIVGINALSANYLSGEIQTAAQPNITSVGTLTSLDVSGAASVGSLTIGGVSLSPAGVNGIRARVYSTPDFNGRVIMNDIAANVDFTDFAPSGQTTDYSMEVFGYIKPAYSENYTFIVTSDDHFRLWINNNLVKADWTTGVHTELQTDPIALVADTWYPIYIQHRQDIGNERLRLVWQSDSQIAETVPTAAFAYDNKEVDITARTQYFQDSFKFYDSVNGHVSTMSVNTSGDFELNSFTSNVNIVGHNGSSTGLELNGTLVTATANEINYNDTTPGTIEASKAVIVDSSRNASNLNNLSMTGTLSVDNNATFNNNLTVAHVVEFNDTTEATDSTDGGAFTCLGGGAFAKKLYVGGDLDVSANVTVTGPILKIPVGNTAARPSPGTKGYVRYNNETDQFEGFGAGNTWGSLGGVMDVNQDTKILAEMGAGVNDDNLRFFNNGTENMRITKYGLTGFGTSAPDKKVEINSATGDVLRLTYDDANGSAANYADFNVSSTGNLTINSSGNTTFIHSTDNFDIVGHDGAEMGLKLAGVLVTANANELNYVDTTPGTAEASKALIMDANRDIANINELSASIINVDTLNTVAAAFQNLNTTGNVGINTSALDYGLEVNHSSGNVLRLTYNDNNGGPSVNRIDFQVQSNGTLNVTPVGTDASFNIIGHNGSTAGLQLNNVLVTATADEINYVDTTQGTAEASKALIMDENRDIANINTISTSVLNATIDNATGNNIAYPLNITRTTNATPANGLGAGIEFYIENSVNSNIAYGSIEVSANTITENSEDGKFVVNLMTGGLSTTALSLTKDALIVEELVETSDRRVKENFQPADLEESYSKIMQLNLVDYNFIHDTTKRVHRGLIAQELREVIPNAVHIGAKDGIADFHTVSSKELVGFLIGAMQHMNNKYDELAAKYDELKKQFDN